MRISRLTCDRVPVGTVQEELGIPSDRLAKRGLIGQNAMIRHREVDVIGRNTVDEKEYCGETIMFGMDHRQNYTGKSRLVCSGCRAHEELRT
jgi:hypothetical protein